MKSEKNDILIEKFLADELSKEEEKEFNEKLQDKDFRKVLQTQLALRQALINVDKKMFHDRINKSFDNYEPRKKKGKKLVLLYSASAIAATLAILLIVFNPFQRNLTSKYIAMADTPLELQIEKIRGIRPGQEKDSLSIFKKCEQIMIAAVPDEKLKEKYFFDGCTLYTFFEDSLPIKVLVDFDKDLNKTYFLCKNNTLYKLTSINNIQEKKLYDLEIIEALDLKQNCD